MKQAGIVLVIGRPNVGKSTLVNAIVGHKVSITSPKPQTTRFPIEAVYEDDRGQLIFIDTPGVFRKAEDTMSKVVNRRTLAAIDEECDVVLYVVDKTRARSYEEGRVLGLIRKLNKPVVLTINKADDPGTDHSAEYRFLEEEVASTHTISAKEEQHIKPLIDDLFSYAHRDYPLVDTSNLVTPALNVTSRMYLEELIREKVYLFTRQELPYNVGVSVDKIEDHDRDVLYIKAQVITTDVRYKKMLIGKEGRMVTEIGRAARKELEAVTRRKVYIDLQVTVDPQLLVRLEQ